MKSHFLILGRQPELSFAEALAVGRRDGFSVHTAAVDVARTEGVKDPAALLQRLGGTVKVAEALGDYDGRVEPFGQKVEALQPEGKIVFGVSGHGGKNVSRTAERFMLELKKTLVAAGRSVRFVRGQDGKLSSVVVAKQKVMEFLFVETPDGVLVGRTLAVQDFEDYSERDYGRPARDARSGMLPPKLARMMVNLAGVPPTATLLDPFCGSGTVLQEAALLGFTNIIGSDNSETAVKHSKENLLWKKKMARMLHTSVASLPKELHGTTVDAVVTEPYLGPPQRGRESLSSIIAELSALYRTAFATFAEIVKPGGRVVFLFPVFYRGVETFPIPSIDGIVGASFKKIAPLSYDAEELYASRLSPRGTLVYHRPGQKVGREVVLLERK